MKNITITLDEKVAAWVRIYAAQRNKSVSRVLGEFLMERMREARDYNEAMRRYLSKKPIRMKPANGHYPTREELYDRAGLR
jgi:hypothetical protein